MNDSTVLFSSDTHKQLAGRKKSGFSRRQFLGTGGAALIAAHAYARPAATRRAVIGKATPRTVAGNSSFDPSLLRLLDRTSFGFTREAYAEAEAMGFADFVEFQLDYPNIDDSNLDARLAAYDTLTMNAEQIYVTYQEMQAVPVLQLMEATTLRAALSKRQLFERMVEFWTDHFNIYILDELCQFLKTPDDRDVIRQHAMTSFPELLNASARSAAMLFYLDNYANIAGHAQENYARELMELHTLGVGGGYTQQDVEEVARCFTGWTFEFRLNNATLEVGDFLYKDRDHDSDSKIVLGNIIPAGGGESDGQAVLDILAYHPNTAEFVGRKLCKHFLGYDPPEDIVETAKQTYLATGGDIKEILRVILHPTVLTYLSTPKLRRPFHYAVSLLRASEANIVNPRVLLDYFYVMGHAPFFWITPDGYPDTVEAWGSSLRPRWLFASGLNDGAIPGVSVSPTALLQSEGGTASGMQAGAIDRILTGERMTTSELDLVQGFYDDLSTGYTFRDSDTFGLAGSMPTLQWY